VQTKQKKYFRFNRSGEICPENENSRRFEGVAGKCRTGKIRAGFRQGNLLPVKAAQSATVAQR
jgi:hypothetical protein